MGWVWFEWVEVVGMVYRRCGLDSCVEGVAWVGWEVQFGWGR